MIVSDKDYSSDFCAYTLFSSSKGNAVYIRCAENEILIDAGTCAKSIQTALRSIGTDIKNIQAILVTHEHSDHIRGIPVIAKKYHIPVHITDPSAAKLSSLLAYPSVLISHSPLYELQIGRLHIHSFLTPHDSNMSVGYTVELNIDDTRKIRIAIATDIGHISEDIRRELIGCDYVLLESNHDREMLIAGNYPYMLKQRILSPRGHLSNDDCAEMLCELAQSGTRHVLLGHLSEKNNTPVLAYSCCRAKLAQQAGISRFSFDVASPNHPTKLA